MMWRVAVCLILSVCCIGCGGQSSPQGADVAGTVTLDGKPLEGVEVFFFTEKFEGFGKTNSEGKYRLVAGAAPGPNKVYLKKINLDVSKNIDMTIPGMDAGQAAAMAAAKSKEKGAPADASVIPTDYSDPKTTKLSFNVPAGGTQAADFRISSK